VTLRKIIDHWSSLVALIAGLLLAAAFPNPGIAGFAWAAPALLVFAARGQKPGKAFRTGYLGGLAFWLASLYWLLFMPAPGFSILGWLALSAYVALFPATWLWAVQSSKFKGQSSWNGRTAWAFGGAAMWVTLEMVRGRFLGGFPWSFLGGSQSEMVPLIQIASVTGVYGISFLIVWTSLSFYSAAEMIFQKPSSRFAWQSEIILPLATVIAVFAFGMFRLHDPAPATSTLRITSVQPAFPQTLIWDEAENTNRLHRLLALSGSALDIKAGTGARTSDLVIWPESAVPDLDEASYNAITNFVRAHHVWLLFNADDILPRENAKNENDNDIFNAAFLFDPDGRFAGVYHKQELVIFGEYIPLEHSLPFIKYLTPIPGSFAAGTEPAQFHLEHRPPARLEGHANTEHAVPEAGAPAGATVSPLICFEDTFPHVARKAVRDDTDFLVNLTNDGWFGDSAEQWQHEANAIFRCIENGIPLVRCANNGITCWIDGHGRVRQTFRDSSGSVYAAGSLTVDVPLQPHTPTFYNRHGDWFGWVCVVLTVIIGIQSVRNRAR
jgi:apolipoprotein N-acyltransferase